MTGMAPRLRTTLPAACVALLLGCPSNEPIDTDASATETGSETSAPTGGDETPTGTTAQLDTGDTEPATESATETGPGSNTETGTSTSTDTDTSTGEPPVGEECQLSLDAPMPYFTGNGVVSWLEPVDESCTVTSSALIGDSVELHLDCPKHAMMYGEVTLILSGPLLGYLPEPDEQLEVFYQPEFDNGIDDPKPELLFVSTDGQLLYAAVRGFFVDPAAKDAAAARYAPLTVSVVEGPCPPLDNPAWNDEGNTYVCEREAVAQVQVGFGEDLPMLLSEGTDGILQTDNTEYVIDVQIARRGENCGGIALERFAYAIVFLASV